MAALRKILVVDDNVDAANTTAELLRHFDLDVDVAYGGEEGLSVARVIVPDVVFLDLGMPFMDGYAVAKALRAEAALRRMKIVALTAWNDQSARAKTKAAGFDAHLTQPAPLADLIAFARDDAH